MKNKQGPKILFLDIETSPLLVSIWQLWENNVAYNQVKKDWNILAWCAKWGHEDKLYYEDLSKSRDKTNDKKMLKKIWQLMDEADVIVTQNGKKFDARKLNARFIINKFDPPSSYKHIDTKLIANRYFGFTTASLEYMCNALDLKYKKLKHKKFPGLELWDECLAGNKEAWTEMEIYNKRDVLALEGLYTKLAPWDTSISFSTYYDDNKQRCKCGGTVFSKNGFFHTNVAKYQRYKCKACGSEAKDRKNLITKAKA